MAKKSNPTSRPLVATNSLVIEQIRQLEVAEKTVQAFTTSTWGMKSQRGPLGHRTAPKPTLDYYDRH